MRGWLRGQRRHSRHRLSLAGLRRQLHRRVRVARVGVVHHRRAQPEDRLPGHLLHRRSDLVHQRSEPDLSPQQRRAEPAHAVDLAVGEQRARRRGWRSTRRSSGRSAASRCRVPSVTTVPAAGSPSSSSGRRRFLPTPIMFPETKGVDSYNDITPRIGVGLGRVRQRQDGAEGELRQISRGRGHGRSTTPNTNPTSRMPVTGGAFATGGVTRTLDRCERRLRRPTAIC